MSTTPEVWFWSAELMDAAVERPAVGQLKVEVARVPADRTPAAPAGDHPEDGQLETVDRPTAISARFIDTLPRERNGTSDSFFGRATVGVVSRGSSLTAAAMTGH
ncbi:hypothetical protein [Streptomyces sp. NPDC016845]|uniref:hypothetical protein n=1 Tax=Streptomyces sp. NPDC016845 TaxID=3364972 RepID=UPI0037AB33A8